jgi:DNA-binding LacI/PurR family transcriptional regulator
MKKKISIKDVASMAGVSVSTVSAVVNNKVGKGIRVGKDTQIKIRQAVEELGYSPNPAAQNLVSGKSQIISVFTYEAAFPFASESEFYSFLLGIEKKAEVSGYDLLLITNRKFRSSTDRQEQVDLNRLKLGDGGILIGVKRHTETLLRLIDDEFPLVFIGRRDMKGREINMVNYDYTSIIDKLVAYGISLGHRKAVYLKNTDEQEPFIDRQKAMNEALKRNIGIECTTRTVEDTLDCSDISEILSTGATLIFIERRSLAVRLKDVCSEMGLTLGEDISAIMLEDQWFSSDIQWTCWSNVRKELGKMSVELLNDLISGLVNKPVVRRIVPELVRGETAGAL